MMINSFVVDRPGFKEDCFNVPAVPEQGPRWAASGRTPERPGLLHLAAQSFWGGIVDDFSPQLHVFVQGITAEAVHPNLGLSEAFRSLFVSEHRDLSPKLRNRLRELSVLPPRWDGETAASPRPEALANVVGLLLFMNRAMPHFRDPFLAPTIDGYAQLEWHEERRTLEFEATPNGWSIVGTEDTSRGEKIYYDAEAARIETEKLVAAYRWFEGSELLWPIM